MLESFLFPKFLSLHEVMDNNFTSHGWILPIYYDGSRVTFAMTIRTDAEHVGVYILTAIFARDNAVGVEQVHIVFAAEKTPLMG